MRRSVKVHEVKPLEFIWKKFPGVYTAENTVHVDDIGRNFVLNPRNGMKIKGGSQPTPFSKFLDTSFLCG